LRIRRPLAAAALAFGASAALSSAAFAHAVFITTENGVRPSSTFELHMYVPDELDPSLWNTEVEVKVPASWKMVSCHGLTHWSCRINVELPNGARGVDFKNSGGVTDPNEDFYFTVTAPATPGSYAFPTIQRYSDGTLIRWVGPPDAGEPAPEIIVLAPGVAPEVAPPTTVDTAPPPSSEEGASTTPTLGTSTPDGSTATTGAVTGSSTGGAGTRSGSHDTLFIALAAGLLSAAGAAVLARARRRR
jgi:Domain of unkown function (DUF1775)